MITFLSAEAKSALARLKWAQDERLQLVSELRISKDETKNVRAEMETIRRSYEERLEHNCVILDPIFPNSRFYDSCVW